MDHQTTPRRVPIRTKLLVGLAVPVLFVAFISGVQAKKAQNNLGTTQRGVTLALAAGGPTTYITALLDERNITALWLLNLDKAVHLARVSTLSQARANTDKAQKEFAESLQRDGSEVRKLFGPALDKMSKGLVKLRAETDKDAKIRNPQNQHAETVYDSFASLIELFHTANANAVRQIDDATLHRRADSIAAQTRSFDLLSLMSRSAAITLLQPATAQNKLVAAEQLGEYRSAKKRAISDLDDDPTHQKVVTGFYTRPSMARFEKGIETFVTTGHVENVPQLINDAANTNHPNGTDAWESVRASLSDRGDSLINSAKNSRNLYVLVFLIATGVSLVFALVIARSIAGPLMSISAQADDLATNRLPGAVGAILATPIGQDVIEPHLDPITVTSRDEVADVAKSINDVQQTALELAVEQAVQRRNFADTFLNLGRRVQGLIARQLEFITDLEDAEQDPETLSNLFKLDHLATRIRRNAESLVVLAGVTRKGRGGAPAPVIDALRSALGEVDQYTRVAIGEVAPARLPMNVAADLSHILAELIENGLNFSGPDTDVEVTGARVDNGYLITVTDYGIGMNDEQVATANRRLSGNESFTVAPSRYMGHYVAGHLATSLGIDVQLWSSQAGTIATVLVGDGLLVNATDSAGDHDASDSTAPGRPDGSDPGNGPSDSDQSESGDTPTVPAAKSIFKPEAPPKAPRTPALSDLLAVHRRLSARPANPEPDRSPWGGGAKPPVKSPPTPRDLA